MVPCMLSRARDGCQGPEYQLVAVELAGAGEHQFFQDCTRDRGEPGRRLVLELDQQVTYSVSH